MKITDTIDHPAEPQRVFELLASEEFQNRKCVASGALSHEVLITPTGDGATIRTRRELPTDDFPDFVKSMIGRTITITETQDWGPAGADGSRTATLTVDVDGAPVAMNGTAALAPGGSGTVESIEGELKANVPLFGSKVEKAAAPAFLAGIRVEGRVAREFLERT